MKNRPISNTSVVTEWEDNVLFDADDPDFCGISPNVGNVLNTNGVTVTTGNIVAPPSVLVNGSTANDSLNALNVKAAIEYVIPVTLQGPVADVVCAGSTILIAMHWFMFM